MRDTEEESSDTKMRGYTKISVSFLFRRSSSCHTNMNRPYFMQLSYRCNPWDAGTKLAHPSVPEFKPCSLMQHTSETQTVQEARPYCGSCARRSI